MASKVRFPIRLKLFLALAAVALAATVSYLALAIGVFREDKTSLVYELNSSAVKTLSAQLDAMLGKFEDKVRLLTQGHRDIDWTTAVFESDPDLVSYELYAGDSSGAWRRIAAFVNPAYLKLYADRVDTAEALKSIRGSAPVPFAAAVAKGAVAYNSSIPGGAPLLSLAVAIELQGSKHLHVAVVDARLDRILSLVASRGIADVVVIDSDGALLAGKDAGKAPGARKLVDTPTVRAALESKSAFEVRKTVSGGEEWLGAFAASSRYGTRVVSEIRSRDAYRAAWRLASRSAIFAGIVITASILISGWISGGMTRPLERLTDATERMSRWDFGESVNIQANDEIGRLARAFNSMSLQLRTQHEQLEQSRQELEIKVRERTAALESERKQASEAQDALIRTTRLASLGELAGVAAHEILNPLNNMGIRIEKLLGRVSQGADTDLKLLDDVVSGWKRAYESGGWDGLRADLERPVEGSRRLVEEDLGNLLGVSRTLRERGLHCTEDIQMLRREMERITRLVNSMRALARVGGERRPVDVHVALDDTALALSDIFTKRKTTLVKDYSADPRELFQVISDPDELVQVFSNLVRNAYQAIDQAGRRAGEIRVSTRRNGTRVEIRIQDNGGGIRREDLQRVFEPSFTTKSADEGTGLGLSITRRLVRAFGGDVEVEKTREGEGTTFLVWFPPVNS